jgi:hypothetical protein
MAVKPEAGYFAATKMPDWFRHFLYACFALARFPGQELFPHNSMQQDLFFS